MQAYLYLLADRPKGRWPKAHWFFDDDPDNPGGIVTAACGLVANKATMYAPTPNYFLEGAEIKGWCQKCQRWVERNREEIGTHERLTRK